MRRATPTLVLTVLFLGSLATVAQGGPPIESIWLEAEQLQGIRGTCWPMGTRDMRTTDGRWGISGPGWAAEWNQGGESGFLSIACGPDDDRAEVTTDLEIPAAGEYRVWVRYRDVREATNRFRLRIEQADAKPWSAVYGEHALFDEDNLMKLYWGWAFGWEAKTVTLKEGSARLALQSAFKESDCRQIDAIVLTTDRPYRPHIKERPLNYAWQVLKPYRAGRPHGMEPLARNKSPLTIPDAWRIRTFQDKGFQFLWNVNQFDWLSDKPDRILYPHKLPVEVQDKDVLDEFKAKYGGQKDVPVFSDPRIVPVFHGSGPLVMDAAFTKSKWADGVTDGLVKWLERNPQRAWASMMNYHPNTPMSPEAVELFLKHRDRYIGAVSGENLGYFDEYVDAQAKKAAIANSKTRRELAAALGKIYLQANAQKYRKIYGRDLENPYREVIPVIGMDDFPLAYHWGARTVGHEAVSVTANMQALNLAMLRGAARQHRGMVLTYRSGNFGDSSAGFSHGSYATVKQILDNYYSPYSGAGMTWWKLDGWYQYMAGSSMFYEEGGGDTYWKPGGLTAAGVKEVQLSPRGKLTDRLLRETAKNPDRGAPYTPVAILMDYANGYSVSPYWPTLFGLGDSQRWSYTARQHADHVCNLHDYLWLAYYPIGPRSEEPLAALTESFVPGIFGDIFDVFYADPKIELWHTLDTYAVTIVAGDVELTAAEGIRLNQYIEGGGTVLVADGQLKGPGAQEVKLPETGAQHTAAGYLWMGANVVEPSQHYRFKPIRGGRPLATTPDGRTVCASFEQGKGRLVFLSVPYALGVDKQVVPIVAKLLLHLTRGLMPIEVEGDVQWLVSRSHDSWLVTLINSAGDTKPQQGISPTDFRENRRVTLHAQKPIIQAHDRLLPSDRFLVERNRVSVVVPAGGVRIMELK